MNPAKAQRITELVKVLREAEQELQTLSRDWADGVEGSGTQADRLPAATCEPLPEHRGVQHPIAALELVILNALPAHIALLDANGVILAVNEAWRHFASANVLRSSDFCVGLNYVNICEGAHGECSDESSFVANGIRDVLSGSRASFFTEYPCHSPDEMRWFRLMVTPLTAQPGSGAVVMHVNVTERRLAEEAAKQSERQQRLLADSLREETRRLHESQAVANVGSWETDLVTLQAKWSDETFRIFDTTPAQFQPTHDAYLQFVHPDDRAMVEDTFRDSLEQQGLVSLDYRICVRGGVVKHVEEHWYVHRDSAGQPVRAVGTCQDITARVKILDDLRASTQALQRSQDILRIAGHTAKLGGWRIDLPGQIVHWSDEVRAIHEEPLGFEPTLAQAIEYYPPEYRDQVTEHVARCTEDGTPFSFELELIPATGRRIWVLAIGEAVRDAQGVIVAMQGALQNITARKEAQASLEQSQRRFREMADTFPFIVWTAVPDGRVDYANATFNAYLGLAHREGTELDWTPFVHPEDLSHCRDTWSASVRTGNTYSIDFRLREAASGDYHWFRVKAQPVRDVAGQIVKWYGTSIDINETKSLEKQARSLASRLCSTLESITDGFLILDADWAFTFLNSQAAHMLDCTQEGLLGKSVWSEFPLLADTPVKEKCLEAARSGLPIHLKECQLVSPYHWYDVSAYPSEEGLVVYFRDVTQSRASIAELQLLRTAVARLNDIVLITEAEPLDTPGPRIIFANEAFERRTGYTQAEVIGKSPRILQGPKTDRAELGRIGKALRAWQPVRSELINYTKDGHEFWLELDIVPIADAKGWFTHWVAVERDITERKMAQEAILQLNSELEDRVQLRTQQLEAANKELEAFSYSVSHDLRSPLSTINGFSQLLLKSDGEQLSEKGKSYLKRIRTGANTMGVLIDGLLSLAKISRVTLNRGDVNLTAMSRKLVQELRDSQPDRVVDVEIQTDLTANGDPAMVAVVMQNLIGNAWKYSGKTSRARLQIGSETDADGAICIFVRDNGAGFDMAYASKLFEVFQRLHQDTDFPGTGIGLANVKRVVERHGGRIWAQAAPGEGATFWFTLHPG